MAAPKVEISPEGEKPFKIDVKHNAFARHYAMNNNQLKAYQHAYGEEVKGAQQSAAILMRKKPVIRAIEYYRIQLSNALDISEARIMAELAAIGLAKPTDALNADGDILPPSEMSEATKRAISEYNVRVVSTDIDEKGSETTILQKTVKFGNKHAALKTMLEVKGYGKINESTAPNIKIINKL